MYYENTQEVEHGINLQLVLLKACGSSLLVLVVPVVLVTSTRRTSQVVAVPVVVALSVCGYLRHRCSRLKPMPSAQVL
jgi:predicted class III extradiol MEMO1 family dioxygenase